MKGKLGWPASIRFLTVLLWTAGLLGITGTTALAHDVPGGSAQYVMADWTFYVFMIFGLCGLIATIGAYKMGLLFHMEDAKYPMLLIPEDDYYTPDWALEDEEEEVAAL